MSRPDLSRLAATGAEVAGRLGVELGEPFELSNFSFVAPAGDDAVLKVRWEEDDESDEEADALRLWNGDGAVRLLDEVPEQRALLLERADPGTDLSTLPEEEATAIAVEIGRRLWIPAGAPFRRVDDYVAAGLEWADRQGGPAYELVPLARELFEALDVGRDILVHGDLHHHNIVSSRRGHLAIDPKPMLGEPEYDVPPFLWNPLGSELRRDVAERRLAAFAAAGLDQRRMRVWAVIRGAYLGHGGRDADVLRGLLAA